MIDDRTPEEIEARPGALSFVAHHAADAAQRAKLDAIMGDDAVSALAAAFSHQGPWDLPPEASSSAIGSTRSRTTGRSG